MTVVRPRPAVLCILDGWGLRPPAPDNAIAAAKTPTWDRLTREAPLAALDASELHVGLPVGQMGNSEVGHMNLGAGRVVMQDLPRIDTALADGSLAASPVLEAYIDRLRARGGTCHLMGLLSPGGVHSSQDHIVGLAKILSAAGVPVAIHAFLDGRDTPPSSAADYVAQVESALAGVRGVTIATLCGRFFAMDRDKRWDRVSQAYGLIVDGVGRAADSAAAGVAAAYAAGETDEFAAPTVLGGYAGVRDGDGLLMANFRADRAREILTALLDPAFDGFERARLPVWGAALGMVEYSSALNRLLGVLFPSIQLSDTLGQVLSDAGLKQARIAETEKYAHVTFFFNGGEETVFPGEDRVLIPSPKVKTYDEQPEMSAAAVTDAVEKAIADGQHDVIVVNYANADMVGHTGIMDAAIQAAEAVDRSLTRLEQAVSRAGGVMLVTADHGNAEQMIDPENGGPQTAHTLNLTPLLLVNGPQGFGLAERGVLADVAPTLLGLLGLAQPAAMTGRSLLVPAAAQARAVNA